MKKFINNPTQFVSDSMEGILMAYPDFLRSHDEDPMAIVRKRFPDPNKTMLVTGGGFGHVPLFLGFVGEGLCDGVAVGNVFSTPSASTIKRVLQMVPTENGVIFIVGNFVGDRINFEIAAQDAARRGIKAKCIIVSDDVMSAPKGEEDRRRCIGGIVFMYKLLGAAAKKGYSFDELLRVGRECNDNMRSYGVALTSCQIPSTNQAIFDIRDNEMEYGTGIHGECGIERTNIMESRDIAKRMVKALSDDMDMRPGEEIALLVNIMGATPLDEGFILFRDVMNVLADMGINVSFHYVDNYISSLEMSGASVSLLRLNEERKELMAVRAYSPFVSFESMEDTGV